MKSFYQLTENLDAGSIERASRMPGATSHRMAQQAVDKVTEGGRELYRLYAISNPELANEILQHIVAIGALVKRA